MELVYHIGAHATDHGRLASCLQKNRDLVAAQGIAIPRPELYQTDLRNAVAIAFREDPPPPSRDHLIETLLDGQTADRIVMSNTRFISIPARIFEDGVLYPVLERRLMALDRLFPDDELEFHFAICNPATFIPEILGMLDEATHARILKQLDPFSIKWSNMLSRMQQTLPHAHITVWCNEDTPLLWSQIIREMCGVDPTTRIAGGFDLLGELMTAEGVQRFQAYIKSHPPQTEVQKRRVIAAFLDKFAKEDVLEEELDVPGWTEDTVTALTDAYEEDVYTIERMHSVNFIAP
ncbi:hypothetical protein [Shimia ponticola]|uniref:hypothetical protein n=1 Tax=Shimia ponticola TaxID=2582893 RepID=UPI0011BE2012|nr:hypothetical protein [Shimia ponticola]